MKNLSVLFLAFTVSAKLFSQGCSDAGVCSIGGMQNHQSSTEKFTIAFNAQYGIGEQNVSILIPQLEFGAKLSEKTSMQLKLPYFFTNGNLGSYSGLGDITITASRQLFKNDKWIVGLNGGVKIGVNNSNKPNEVKLSSLSNISSLPMPYQSSLGTHDVLIGFDSKLNDKYLFAIGFQMPIIQFNKNTFDTSFTAPSETDAKKYFSSNQLFRRPDLVLRADRQFKASEKLYINGGLLAIYHLGHDRSEDSAGVSHAISGSNGLTLNINFGLTYAFSPRFSIIGRYASPLIVRKVRPDGLTRQFVTGLELKYAF